MVLTSQNWYSLLPPGLAYPSYWHHSLNRRPHLRDFVRRMMGRFACHPVEQQVLADLAVVDCCSQLAVVPPLSKAHHTRHKKRNHLDSRGLRNNIRPLYYPPKHIYDCVVELLPRIHAQCKCKMEGYSQGVPLHTYYESKSSKRCVSLRVLLPMDLTWSCEIC